MQELQKKLQRGGYSGAKILLLDEVLSGQVHPGIVPPGSLSRVRQEDVDSLRPADVENVKRLVHHLGGWQAADPLDFHFVLTRKDNDGKRAIKEMVAAGASAIDGPIPTSFEALIDKIDALSGLPRPKRYGREIFDINPESESGPDDREGLPHREFDRRKIRYSPEETGGIFAKLSELHGASELPVLVPHVPAAARARAPVPEAVRTAIQSLHPEPAATLAQAFRPAPLPTTLSRLPGEIYPAAPLPLSDALIEARKKLVSYFTDKAGRDVAIGDIYATIADLYNGPGIHFTFPYLSQLIGDAPAPPPFMDPEKLEKYGRMFTDYLRKELGKSKNETDDFMRDLRALNDLINLLAQPSHSNSQLDFNPSHQPTQGAVMPFNTAHAQVLSSPSSDYERSLGFRIAYHQIIERGMSNQQLAQALVTLIGKDTDITPDTVHRWHSNQELPTENAMSALETVLIDNNKNVVDKQLTRQAFRKAYQSTKTAMGAIDRQQGGVKREDLFAFTNYLHTLRGRAELTDINDFVEKINENRLMNAPEARDGKIDELLILKIHGNDAVPSAGLMRAIVKAIDIADPAHPLKDDEKRKLYELHAQQEELLGGRRRKVRSGQSPLPAEIVSAKAKLWSYFTGRDGTHVAITAVYKGTGVNFGYLSRALGDSPILPSVMRDETMQDYGRKFVDYLSKTLGKSVHETEAFMKDLRALNVLVAAEKEKQRKTARA